MSMSQRRLTKAQATEKLGISGKQLERYVSDGIPCTGAGVKRRFPWPEIRAWRDKLLVSQGKAKAEKQHAPIAKDDIAKALDRKAMAEAQLLELKLLEAQGRSISLDVHEERVRSLCEPLAARCRSLTQYMGDVQLAKTEVEAAALLERIGDSLLRALTESADSIDDSEDVEAEDDKVA